MSTNPLEPRKEEILRAVIVEYIQLAEPVGSESIAQKYSKLGIRSATVRNELAEMSDMGYLEQPHTSAGRIPSDQGYRYYVDHLVSRKTPEIDNQGKVLQVTENGEVLRALLQETTKTLSRLTHLLSAASTLREGAMKIRHAVLSVMGPERALLVLVLANGHVENRLVDCPVGLSLNDIGQANALLSALLVDKTVRSLSRMKGTLSGNPVVDKFVAAALSQARIAAKDLTRGSLFVEGEEYIFAQPEFRRSEEACREVMASLENDDAILDILNEPADGPETITIGKENRSTSLRPLTVIRHTFFVGTEEAGSLALIGPTRMNYENSIPLLSFTAQAIGDALTKINA